MKGALAIALALAACGPAPESPPAWPSDIEPARFVLSDVLERRGVLPARIADRLLALAPRFEFVDDLNAPDGRDVRGSSDDRTVWLRTTPQIETCIADSAIVHELAHLIIWRLTEDPAAFAGNTADKDHALRAWWDAVDVAADEWKDMTCPKS